MRRLLLICGIFSMFISPISSANEEFYFGGNYSLSTWEFDTTPISSSESEIEFEPEIINGAIGFRFNEYVSFEVRLGFELGSEPVYLDGLEHDLTINSTYGTYTIFSYPLEEIPIKPYVILGYTRVDISMTVSGPRGAFTIDQSQASVSYGLGGSLTITDNLSVYGEYISLYQTSDGYDSVVGMNFGLNFGF